MLGVDIPFFYDGAGKDQPSALRQDVDLITTRLNYRFNWGGAVVGK